MGLFSFSWLFRAVFVELMITVVCAVAAWFGPGLEARARAWARREHPPEIPMSIGLGSGRTAERRETKDRCEDVERTYHAPALASVDFIKTRND